MLSTFWLIVEGRVVLEVMSSAGRLSRLGLFGPGHWIGNYASPAPSPADMIALDRVQLLAFRSGNLPELAEGRPGIASMLAASFARQLAAVFARLDARSTLTSKGRVFAELMRRSGTQGEISPLPVVSELALAAQTTRETASRALGDLERRGIIRRDADRLVIISPRLLADLVV